MERSPSGGSPGSDATPDDPGVAGPPEDLSRFGPGELARACAVALRASELCGGRPCRIELVGEGLTPEGRGGQEMAAETRSALGHAVRGHLHTAVLHADNLLLTLRDRDPDVAELREGLEGLKATVRQAVEKVHGLVDGPEEAGGRPAEGADGPGAEARIPELLRGAREAAGGGDGSPRVEMAGEVPPVRGEPSRLERALVELFELARRSPGAVKLVVGPDVGPAHGPGVRVALSVDPGPRAAPEAAGGDSGPAAGEAGPRNAAAGAPRARDPGDPGGGTGRDRPSLREVVDELGGRLWVEAGDAGGGRASAAEGDEGAGGARDTRVAVVLVLPAAGG